MSSVRTNRLFERVIALTVAVFVIASFMTSPPSRASNPYPAFNEIGHNPLDFSLQDINNGGSVSGAGFNTPIGIAMDTDNHWLFVADAENDRVIVFDLDSNYQPIDSVADHVLGQLNLSSIGGTGNANGTMNYPDVLEYDHSHHRLFVSDGTQDRVMIFDFSGGSITDGVDANYILGGGGAASPVTMQTPNGLAYDSINNRLYVDDTGHNRTLVFDVRSNGSSPQTLCGVTTTGIATGMSASCVLGEPNFTTVADGTFSDASTLIFPIGLFLDEDTSMLYVTSDMISIRVYDVSSISNGEPAVHYLGANFTTLSYDPGTDTTFDPGMTNHNVWDPRGMVMDHENNILFVTDTLNQRVLGFDVASITDGEAAVSVIGVQDFVTNTGGNVGQTYLYNPQWSVWDPTSRTLYVVDAVNNRVMLFKIVGLSSTALSSGTTGASYTSLPTTTNSQGTVTYELLSGTLPTGLSLSSSGLVGTPTAVGTYNFTLRAVDTVGTAGNFYSNHQSFSVTIAQGSTGGSGGPIIYECNDGLDNNSNGLIDLADASCHTDGNALNPASYDGTRSETTVSSPPTDVCPNISGTQASLPSGMMFDSSLNCIDISTPPVDLCPNIAGDQSTIPLGMSIDGVGNCVTPPPPPPDLCQNIPGIQSFVPPWLMQDAFGDCIPNPTPPVDLCPNISGTQSSVPLGMVVNSSGNCVTPVLPALCADVSATNFGSVLPCTYTPPPPATCTDASATNFGGTLPCTYPLPIDPCIANPSLCAPPPVTPVVVTSSSGGCSASYVSGIGGIAGTILDNVVVSYQTVGCVLSATYTKLKTASTLVSTIGIIFAGISTIGSILFLNPFSFSEIALLPMRIWSLIMSAFGLKKRNRPWGVVYDSVTKQPLDPVYVILQDLEGKEVASSITDMDGRYGFFVNKGVYKMVPSKPNYFFASRLLSGKNRDELYGDLYFGDYFEVKEDGQVITKNIPMDPLKFDWNEFAKRDRKLMRFYSKWDFIFARIASVLFAIGFIVATVAIFTAPTLYNKIIFTLYVVLFVLRLFGVTPTKLGSVAKAKNGDPLSFAVVHLISPTGIEIGKKVANKFGKFYFLAANGNYTIKVEEKKKDQSYALIKEQEVSIEKGVLNKHLKV